ncbi:Gfo/Idh/MocA family protein [Catellatospora bangladeshensis]|uniref:Oxidoreductase n=1 Tax=Catellatospora bangladeshensis TaxID=310355 RepID=A0A8J3NG06_9ACTN|nr:Gfo/Idh/MocA family oxidoreductase [Catellatospora bangladeshensis]GIF79887.1 oxidoreductase [Catellatospora bangladeshensis]
MTATTVALIGANGHGMYHRRQLAELAEQTGAVRLVALADTREVVDPPDGVPVYTDHVALLVEVKPQVVIVCTPPHTHLALTRDALRAGADVLLEKPPVLDRAEHEALVAAEAETGRVVQVGFQALASPALVRLRAAVAGGALGAVRHISVLGCWKRDDAYWARSPWSGRRTVDGRPSLDGALANPFAHAVMQALSVLDAPVERVEVDWLRVRPIEVEDTATLRITLSGGVTVLVAVTLAGEGFVDGDLTVYGERGDAELGFREDLLRLPGEAAATPVAGRRTLLENLLAHRAEGEPLLAPLSRTAPFTTVIEQLRAAPPPYQVAEEALDVADGHRTLRGVNTVLARCAARGALMNELSRPWSATVPDGTANG